jgi:hypothetical protein
MIVINDTEIIGNTVSATMSFSVEVLKHPWKLRAAVLGARTRDGRRSQEVETITGIRVVMRSVTGEYNPVPINNDDVVLSMDDLYEITTVSVQATACDVNSLTDLISLEPTSVTWHIRRKLLLDLIGSQLTSYQKKLDLLIELHDLDDETGISVQVSNLVSLPLCRFAENGGLEVSYWTNGPYADLRMSLVSRIRIKSTL